MPVRFDPYHKWLGIPQTEQPAHHYRLLGVQPLESDPDVISNAADQRMGLLKSFANSEYSSLAEDLLNEVSRARVCLLNPAKKQAYDGTLRGRLGDEPDCSHEPRSFWLPPRDRVGDTLVVSCLNCETDASYVLQPSSQLLPCKSCHEILPIPSREEVVAAATQLKRKAPTRPDVSSNTNANENSSTSKSRVTQQAFPQSSAENTHVTHDNELQFAPLDISRIPDRQIVKHRRKKSTQSPLVFLFSVIVGGLAGLSAGYLVLCYFDLRYDFLHLIAPDPSIHQNDEKAPVPQKDVPQLPDVPAPNKQPLVIPNGKSKPVPIARPADPFKNLPLRLPLPQLPANNHPITLFAIPRGQLDNFELTIINGGNVRNSHLILERLSFDGAKWMSMIKWKAEVVSEVATFSIVNNKLQFAWSNAPVDVGVAALRNSVLKVCANNQPEHFVLLREATMTAPLTFDLDKGVQRVDCDSGDLPDIKDIRVDLMSLDGCPPYKLEGKGLLKLEMNDETIIWYKEAAGAATKIKFANFKRGPSIELEHRYRLPSGVEDAIVVQSVERKIIKMQKALAKKDNSKMKTDLNALILIGALAKKLDKTVKLRYRFYLFVDGHEIELVTTK